jgi:hypoxanthine phosphoribosyltransferase
MAEKLCFVAMPFGEGPEYEGGERESTFIFENIVKPAVAMAVEQFRTTHGDTQYNDLEVCRELETVDAGDITQSIIRHLAHSHITIVDLTGRNPNVFFELGVRFALKRNGTILLTQDRSEIPFNIQQFRVVEYDPRFDGIEQAIERLSGTIHTALKTLAAPSALNTDSLIFQALPELKIAGPGLTEEAPSPSGDVTWEEYWERTTHIERELAQLHATGVYSPDVLIGISNGGLFLADTCLRLVYGNNIPIICLWAQRSKENYFANPINNAMVTVDVFKELGEQVGVNKKRPLRVLVMDDIVGTQRTFSQLVDYLEERLGDTMEKVELHFVFIFTPRDENLSKLQRYLLSADPVVAKNYQHMELEQVTTKSQLPYLKNIHYGDVAPTP